MAELINVTSPLQADANEGRIVSNPERMGNRRYGQKMFLSGTEVPIAIEDAKYSWSAFEALTISTTALSLTSNVSDGKEVALITVADQAVRFRIDGQAPTATVGHALEPGATLKLVGFHELDKFKAIRRDAADAILSVSYGVRRYE